MFGKFLSNALPSNAGCEGSYAAGGSWGLIQGPVFEGEIEYLPCTNASSQFRYVCIIVHLNIIKCIALKRICISFCSLVVTMSRECGTNGQWSSVDFSSCTFSSETQPPFILIWLLLSTFSVTESSAVFASEVSYILFFEYGNRL